MDEKRGQLVVTRRRPVDQWRRVFGLSYEGMARRACSSQTQMAEHDTRYGGVSSI
jgi:hypothetical protein